MHFYKILLRSIRKDADLLVFRKFISSCLLNPKSIAVIFKIVLFYTIMFPVITQISL